MRHPSLTCRAGRDDPRGHRCPAPAVAGLAVAAGHVVIRPLATVPPGGLLLCCEHLHARIDRLLLAATPAPEARP